MPAQWRSRADATSPAEFSICEYLPPAAKRSSRKQPTAISTETVFPIISAPPPRSDGWLRSSSEKFRTGLRRLFSSPDAFVVFLTKALLRRDPAIQNRLLPDQADLRTTYFGSSALQPRTGS